MRDKPIVLSTAAVLLASIPVWAAIPGDFEPDGDVDFNDFAVFVGAWLTGPDDSAWNPACDVPFPPDQLIDSLDLTAFSNYLLACEPPDLAPNMVLVPGGTFQMGDTFNYSDRLRVHTVTVDSFYMDKYEITNRQYCAFLNSSLDQGLITVIDGVVYKAGKGMTYPYCDTSTRNSSSQIAHSGGVFSVRTKGGRDMSNYPMACIGWYGTVAYCNWRSQQEGYEQCYDLSTWNCDFSKHGYRLATEAEWEYAARGGLPGKRFPWGETITQSHANYRSGRYYSYDQSPRRGYHPAWNDGIYPYTSPIGSFSANAYGLYDMSGNVWEWCNDWYQWDYYTRRPSPHVNPTGPTLGRWRVLRGGCWGVDASFCRVAERYLHSPDLCYHYFGFRVVLNWN